MAGCLGQRPPRIRNEIKHAIKGIERGARGASLWRLPSFRRRGTTLPEGPMPAARYRLVLPVALSWHHDSSNKIRFAFLQGPHVEASSVFSMRYFVGPFLQLCQSSSRADSSAVNLVDNSSCIALRSSFIAGSLCERQNKYAEVGTAYRSKNEPEKIQHLAIPS